MSAAWQSAWEDDKPSRAELADFRDPPEVERRRQEEGAKMLADLGITWKDFIR